MIVGSLQMNVKKNDKEANLAAVEKFIDTKADLVVLPELFSTGYFFETREEIEAIAEVVPKGETTKRLIEIAKKKSCSIVGTLVEKEGDRLYITAVVVGPTGYLGKHRKRHLTNDEVLVYSCGETSEVYNIGGCKIGIVVCFEGWFPESARELMVKGAQVICHTALIMSEKTVDIMRTRAIENKVYVIIANAMNTETYKDKVISFRGDSRVIDYNGNILVNAEKEEKLILTEIDESKTKHKDLEDCSDLIKEIKKHKI